MAVVASTITAGSKIGNYRIVERLGVGGMGEVWIAEHELLGRRAAIKLLLPRYSQQTEVIERFFAEARAAAKISDPGIVHVYDFGWHDSDAYIAMELLTGESLAERLQRERRLEIFAALRLVHQLAVTMVVAHRHGIVHRDLKPDNLYVVPDPAVFGGERIKVLDFGVAKLLGDELSSATRTQSGVILGTPTYMSPEQCRGSVTVDHHTDIYALGCILYAVICGRPPFVNSTVGDMIASQLLEEPDPPSVHTAVPDGLDALVLSCLEKNIADRFDDMATVAQALNHLIELHPPIAPNSRPGLLPSISVPVDGSGRLYAHEIARLDTPVARPARSRRRMAALGAAILATAVATVAISRRLQADDQELAPASSAFDPQPVAVAIDAPPHDGQAVDALEPSDAAEASPTSDAAIGRARPHEQSRPDRGSGSAYDNP